MTGVSKALNWCLKLLYLAPAKRMVIMRGRANPTNDADMSTLQLVARLGEKES